MVSTKIFSSTPVFNITAENLILASQEKITFLNRYIKIEKKVILN